MNADVAARTAPTCAHGVTGYCADEALPAEREAVEYLHRSAYDWAIRTRGDRDLAETFATWTVRDAWTPGCVVVERSHRLDWDTFLRHG